jgi:thymidylate synthase ThyX
MFKGTSEEVQMFAVRVVADSVNADSLKRPVTFQLRYPKFIHGEFMTHRVISRNASSSRAVPTTKLLEEVRNPLLRTDFVEWGKNQSGMQAKTLLEGADLEFAKKMWGEAAMVAARYAEILSDRGVHKQIVNRLLEPFSHINVVATATEWNNFFGLRLHKDAQPEMRHLAKLMWEAYDKSVPNVLLPGQWHLPYIRPQDYEVSEDIGLWGKDLDQIMIKVSVARCARVSYTSHETGKISTLKEDLALYERLLGAQPLHASPAEHQCTPDVVKRGEHDYLEDTSQVQWENRHEWGNLVGWRQYRKMLKGEACAPLPDEFLPF